LVLVGWDGDDQIFDIILGFSWDGFGHGVSEEIHEECVVEEFFGVCFFGCCFAIRFEAFCVDRIHHVIDC
tara:strand:+ start:466 stop:675 length:210 start_codon:yes stop_codon:yes gene_type:complete